MMITRVLSVVAISVSLAHVASHAQQNVEIIADGYTKVHKTPARQSSVIAFAKKGDHYPLLSENESWVKILFVEVEGWVEKQNIAVISDPSKPPSATAPAPPPAELPAHQAAEKTAPPPQQAERKSPDAMKTAEIIAEKQADVYNAPDKKSKIVAIAQKGARYPVLLEGSTWVKILSVNTEGWVENRHVEITTEPPRFSAPVVSAYPPSGNGAAAAGREPPAGDSPESTGGAPLLTSAKQRESSSSAPPSPPAEPAKRFSFLRSLISPERKSAPAPSQPEPPDRPPEITKPPARLGPEIKNVPVAETLFVRIEKPSLSVFERIDPQSPILGMAQKGRIYPLLNQYESWLKILYNDNTGWIERRYATVIERRPAGKIPAAPITVILLSVVFALAFPVIFLVGRLRNVSPRQAALRRSALIISRGDTTIRYTMTNTSVSLSRCFTDVGFATRRVSDLAVASNRILHHIPDVLLVDWQFSPSIARDVDSMLLTRSSTTNVLVIFYNVLDPAAITCRSKLTNIHYFGIRFSDRDLFKLITPLVITGEKTKVIKRSVEESALEGELSEGGLLAAFQIIEIGNKRGCILIQYEKPFGMLYFKEKQIIFASTPRHTGIEAVHDILNLKNGHFRFIADTEPSNPNCAVPIMAVLMEWAKEQDETHRN